MLANITNLSLFMLKRSLHKEKDLIKSSLFAWLKNTHGKMAIIEQNLGNRNMKEIQIAFL